MLDKSKWHEYVNKETNDYNALRLKQSNRSMKKRKISDDQSDGAVNKKNKSDQPVVAVAVAKTGRKKKKKKKKKNVQPAVSVAIKRKRKQSK